MDNLNLRAWIEQELQNIPLDYAEKFDFIQVQEAYPPIGMDIIEQLSLAYSGNRPVQVQTTEDRFRETVEREGLYLDIFWNHDGPEFVVRNISDRCTACNGGGKTHKLTRSFFSLDFTVAPIDKLETITAEDCINCSGTGKVRKPKNPNIRHGDYSAVDAWLRRSKDSP